MPGMNSVARNHAFSTIFLWSTSYVATKVVMGVFTAGPLALLRCLVASVVLVAVMRARRVPFPDKADLPRFLLPGLLGLALYTLLFNHGAKLLNPTTTCIMIATSPVIVALLARLLLGERLAAAGWAAIGLAFAGVVVMSLWDGSVEGGRGILWTALASLSISFYNIVQRKLSLRFPPLQIIVLVFLAASLQLCIFIPGLIAEIRLASAWHIAIAVFMGVFPSAIGYLLWMKAISLAERTSQVTNFMFLTPFLSLLLELAILRQLPDAGTLVGGLIIMAGLALFSVAGRPGT